MQKSKQQTTEKQPGTDCVCDICGAPLKWIEQKFPKLSNWQECPLHAAAPDLLEACKALCVRLEHNELVNRPHIYGNHYDQPTYDAAQAAIAKAEGTKP